MIGLVLWKSAIRFTAILLLLTAASCLLATDPLFPQSCQEDSSNPNSSGADPGCFCCCIHVIPVPSGVPSVTYAALSTVPELQVVAISTDPPLIYHPPRV